MTTEAPAKRRTRPPSRRIEFSVKEQLLGKLGPRGYGRLLQKLAREVK